MSFTRGTLQLTPPESELAYGGWAATSGTNDDNRPVITPTALTNITEDRSFYPVFKSGHWITFYAGATGSGATYTAPAFVIANSAATDAQPTNPEWKGYVFQYWTDQNLYTGENGAYVQPTSAPERFNFNSQLDENKTLYAYWTPANTTYTVVFWRQNVTDSKTATGDAKTYSFAGQETKNGTTGTTVNASNYSRYKSSDGKIDFSYGFDLNNSKSDTSVVIKADGTSVINVYFDRQIITLKFYKNGTSTNAPGYDNTYYNTTSGNNRVTVYTGLYGQTLAQNNYEWPSGSWNFYTTNSTAGMSYLGQFVFPLSSTGGRIVRDTNNQEMRLYYIGASSKTIYFFLQNVDGSYPTTYSARGYASSNAGTYNISNKYDGFEVVSYQRGNTGNGTTGTWTNTAEGGVANISNYNTLGVRFARKNYTLKYLDSVDGTELSGITTANVVYGASLTGYKPAASYTPVSQYAGKEWDGKWYKDQACTDEFDWSVTMPNDNMVVYAGWEDIYYKVDIDPNGGVLTSSESTFTWLTYGKTIQRYDDVVRDYVEDPNGSYKYESWLRSIYTSGGYDPWDYSGYLRSAQYVDSNSNNSSTMNPYSEEGSSVTINYPYDSTRYRYEKGAYALIGWYEITFAEGHYGDMAYKTGEKLYTFGTGVTHDTYIQAKWRKVGDYHVEYKLDVYLMDEEGTINTTESGIDTSNVPMDSNSYADQSQSAIMRSADSPLTVTTGEGEEAETKQYVFKGWYYNGQLYEPGDVFTVLSSLAEDKVIGYDAEHNNEPIIQKTVYIYPVYQSVEDLPVDVTHITWFSNFNDNTGNQIGSLTPADQLTYDSKINDKDPIPNEAVDIPTISTVIGSSNAYVGYTFLGWAKVPETVDTEDEHFNASSYMYLYWDGSDFHIDSTTGTPVTQVAADEFRPYDDMYAVWEINKYTVTVTKTVEGNAADQHTAFTFAPVFTDYTGGSNFVLAGEQYTFTDDEGVEHTYYTSKEFAEVPYGSTLTLTENDEEDFTTTVKYTVTTDVDGTAIQNPTEVDGEDGATYTIQGDTTIAYTNTRNKQKLKIVKAGDNTEGASIAGAAFTLNETNYGTLTSAADGKVTNTEGTEIFSLDVGSSYTLTETAAPTYFEGLTGSISINAASNGLTITPASADTANVSTSQDTEGVYTVTITNIRKTADITITKNVEGFETDKTTPFEFTVGGVSAESVTKELVGDTSSDDHSVTYTGIAYGTQITVTEESYEDFDTKYSLNNADAVDGSSCTFVVDDEVVSDGTVNLVFTNTRNKQIVKVFKVETGTTKGLEGAVFDLTGPEGSNKSYTGVSTNGDGWLVVEGETSMLLPINSSPYILEETQAPSGYDKIGGNIEFTVSPGSVVGATEDPDNPGTFIITVQNSAGVTLPHTGGPGTLLYTLSGLALILASALMYGFRMRRRERRLN